MGTLTVDNLNVNSTLTADGLGKVLQVVQTTKTDTFSTSSATFTDLTGMAVNITPVNSSNKVLVFVNTNASTSSTYNTMFNLVRGSTDIFKGDVGGGSQSRATSQARHTDSNGSLNVVFHFLDSPSTTSQVTYKVQIMAQSGGTSYVNRTSSDSNSQGIARITSTITAIEVGA